MNDKEAEVVRMIYDLYLQGYGTYTIAKRLEAMGIKNKKGDVHWTQGGVMYIIRNKKNKNKGDICQGKSFTTDPISKRRIKNFGEEDMFYIKDHHEPIVSREVWDKANENTNVQPVNQCLKRCLRELFQKLISCLQRTLTMCWILSF